jgi:hypothetical protein
MNPRKVIIDPLQDAFLAGVQTGAGIVAEVFLA